MANLFKLILLDLTSSNTESIVLGKNGVWFSFASPSITLSIAINWTLDSVFLHLVFVKNYSLLYRLKT